MFEVLIDYKVENWKSFRDPVTLSMVASKERQHGERVTKLQKYATRVLPVAAVYGANASGKSNLFDSLRFAKEMVTESGKPDRVIQVQPFKLNSRGIQQPSSFRFEMLIDECIYEFSFSVTQKTVVEEKLVETKRSSERVLYHRKNGESNFNKSLNNHKLLELVSKSTRDDQLFLTTSVYMNISKFKPVFDWFDNHLRLIAPRTKFKLHELLSKKEQPLLNKINDVLPELDMGISRLGAAEIRSDSLPFLKELMQEIQADMKDGEIVEFNSRTGEDDFFVIGNGDFMTAKRRIGYHLDSEGNEVIFEWDEESDGTQRAIDLLPAIFHLISTKSNSVYVIDELDRRLHTMLTRNLLEKFLTNCNSESRSQLLFTTHDLLLMDQDLFRRDEMWLTERDHSGRSDLFSFGDFRNIRYDKDLRKSYLQGRFGGIPSIPKIIG